MAITKINSLNTKKMTNQKMTNNIPHNFTAQQNTPILDNKKSGQKITLTVLTLAALAGIAYWQREALGLTKAIKSISNKGMQKLETKINQLKDEFRPKAQSVLKENTINGMVKLEKIEPAAAMRSASKTEKEPFHQAASWIEEAYKDAYSRAELKDGNNILDYIYRRIGAENDTLAQMYAQMPEKEATIRIKQFASEAIQKDTHNGMTTESFIKGLIEKVVPKAKENLQK